MVDSRYDLPGALRRLRALSSLALVALEREDLRRLQEVVSEGDAIVRELNERTEGEMPEDIRVAIADVIGTNRRVVEELELKRLGVARDLAELRRNRAQVAEARQAHARVPSAGVVDRMT